MAEITIRLYDEKEPSQQRPLSKGECLYACVQNGFVFGKRVVRGHCYVTSGGTLEEQGATPVQCGRFRFIRQAEHDETGITSGRPGKSHPAGILSSQGRRQVT